MADNELWERLIDLKSLKLGWHLARRDQRQDFLDLPYYVDAYGVDLERKLREIQRLLISEKYAPSPLTHVEVPKGTLAIRPGSVPGLADRIVLQTIIALVAPSIDTQLSDAVYSYRLRAKKPHARHGLFRESDVIDLPFLKRTTISRTFDPFEGWYAAWPEFDKASRRAFEEESFTFLAVSDISAYFANIQLLIRRDLLLKLLLGEEKIVNLLFLFLEAWSTRTADGRHHWRGVPQGTQIGGFLGNLFLAPLDEVFGRFCKDHDAKYFRYGDDVKVSAKDDSVARFAILTMDRALRRLHLNTQSAKTVVLRENPNKEITQSLIDERLERIQDVIDYIRVDSTLDSQERIFLVQELDELARHRPRSPEEQAIYGARRPLKDMSLRTFRRLMTAYTALGEHKYVARLFDEIETNPDYRLTRKLIRATQLFPNKRQVNSRALRFVKSQFNIFPHQEAELLWATRYLLRVPAGIMDHCKGRLLDESADFYVRIQSARLFSRTELNLRFVRRCHGVFADQRSYLVQVAFIGVLVQLPSSEARRMLDSTLFHPNETVRNASLLFVRVRDAPKEARQKLEHIFRGDALATLCDYVPLLYAMALSDLPEITTELWSKVQDRRRGSGLGDMAYVLDDLLDRIEKRGAGSAEPDGRR